MKQIIPITVLAAIFATSSAIANTAYSTPSGYVTQDLAPNQFNLVGLTLHNGAIAAGAFSGVASTVLTDSNASFTVLAERTYVLEIKSGVLAGFVQEVPSASISGNTITTLQDLDAMGLEVGDTYAVRLAPTLEEIFGIDANSSLTRALGSGGADIVWIPNGTGGYDQYFVHSPTSAFRIAGTTTPAPNVPIIYTDGLLVQKRSTASSLVITGEVKTTDTRTGIIQGFNLISIVAPVGVTLQESNLHVGLQSALGAGGADLIWVPQPGGTYVQYFRHNAGNWRNVAAATVPVVEPVVLPPTIFVQRRGATPTNAGVTVPAFYSNL